MSYLLVFLGGGLGSIARYGITHLLARYQFGFPYATLAANVVASLLLGLLLGLSHKGGTHASIRFLFMVGFCGGFSTFSTFSGETVSLFEQGQYALAVLNILVSLLLCFGAILLGMRLVL